MLEMVTDWTIHVEVDAALRAQGMEPDVVRQRSPRLVAVTVTALDEGLALVQPLVLMRKLAVSAHQPEGLLCDAGALPCGAEIATRLAPADSVVVLAATVGPSLEERAVELLVTDPPRALALLGIAGAAVEDLAVQACKSLQERGNTKGRTGIIPCWPGCPAWPNDPAQKQIFDLLDPAAEAADFICLTPSRIIQPSESISWLIGLSSPAVVDSACDDCPLWLACGQPRV
jgi:hypothetical protein